MTYKDNTKHSNKQVIQDYHTHYHIHSHTHTHTRTYTYIHTHKKQPKHKPIIITHTYTHKHTHAHKRKSTHRDTHKGRGNSDKSSSAEFNADTYKRQITNIKNTLKSESDTTHTYTYTYRLIATHDVYIKNVPSIRPSANNKRNMSVSEKWTRRFQNKVRVQVLT